jgi:hypothetical protein
MTTDAEPSTEHPSPHRERVSQRALLLSIGAGPAAWITQLVVTYGFAAHGCNPSAQPPIMAPAGGWPGEHTLLLAVNLACLIVAVAAGLLAVACWRQTSGEKPGGGHTLLDIGEGRARFLAGCGVLTSAGFMLAILFNTAELFMVPACWSVSP